MSQPCEVMSFRARLIAGGYTEVSIYRLRKFNDQWIYRVLAVEPLAGIPIWRDMDIVEMHHWR